MKAKTKDIKGKTTKSIDTAVPFTSVKFEDTFWAPRQKAVRQVTIPFLYGQCEKAGMIKALDVKAPPPKLEIGFQVTPIGVKPATPVMYWDSDIGKWIEAAGYTLSNERDKNLEELIDGNVAKIAAAQRPDGYFNTYFQRHAPDQTWSNLRDWHELYCAGHMIEGAVAYAAATGKRELLDVMCRYVDHIDKQFGPEPGKRRGYCGHEEIELALVKLARFTGNDRYMQLARYFIDERGRQPHYFDIEAVKRGDDPQAFYHRDYNYNQSHVPVREQDKVVGHAVRAMYLYSAMADLAAEDKDQALHDACLRLWTDLTTKRLYVTGGLGPSWTNEGFTKDYDLPNETAYAETCAAIGLVFWAHRLTLATGESRFADVMERALYNGALTGLSLTGDRFFYENPLASRGSVERWIWHRCPCCPANIARLVASLGQYVASATDSELSVHLYAKSSLTASVGGVPVMLHQDTTFPWDGDVAISVDPAKAKTFALRLRIPDWCPSATASVNGESVATTTRDRGYLRIERTWQPGDKVRLHLAMPARRLYARPELVHDVGRTALQRGPFIYCVEEADNGRDVEQFIVDQTADITVKFDAKTLGGVVVLEVAGWAGAPTSSSETLYSEQPPELKRHSMRAIPYPLWAHRGGSTMAVWLRSARGGQR